MTQDEVTALRRQRLLENLAALPRMASAWVMSLAGVLAFLWLQLPPEQQQLVVAHSPLPVWSYPVVLSLAGIAARVWPQKSFLPPVDADAELRSTR